MIGNTFSYKFTLNLNDKSHKFDMPDYYLFYSLTFKIKYHKSILITKFNKLIFKK